MEIIKIKKREIEPNVNLKKINVAAYVRVSTSSEQQEYSFENQRMYYENKISKNGNWNFINIYSDYGITGTNTTKRTEFNKMIEDALAGKIDLILTKSISRFSRNSVDTLSYVRLLAERGIGVIFEEKNIYTLTMESKMLISVLASVAEKEAELTSTRIKTGKHFHYENGEPSFNASCFGYNYDKETKKLSVNKYEAEAVKIIFKKYLDGEILADIERYLNRKGYKTRKGKRFDVNSLSRIIRNDIYTGDVTRGKYYVDELTKKVRINRGKYKKYLIKNTHEAIISREDFEKVQRIIGKKSNLYYDSDKYKPIDMNLRLTGIVRCGFCGSHIKLRNSAKSIYKFYKCTREQDYGQIIERFDESICIKTEFLEGAFLSVINTLLDNGILKSDDNIENTIEYQKLDKKRKIILEEISKLVDAYIKQNINLYDYNFKRKKLENDLAKINEDINKLKKERNAFDIYQSLKNDLKGITHLEELNPIFFKNIVKYVIIGERLGSKKEGAVLRFIYNKDKKNDAKNITKEEIIDKNYDSGRNNLKTILDFKYFVKFKCFEKNIETGKRKKVNHDFIKVKFEYESEN